jgi:hypothetical protein
MDERGFATAVKLSHVPSAAQVSEQRIRVFWSNSWPFNGVWFTPNVNYWLPAGAQAYRIRTLVDCER